ncbi:homoserine kinase [Nocardioides mesophilus]|uniref:Homoserine kinase n=1 Tax=Nocardioides mesophilus TaxID=433659 RepID=A0A7G9R8M7_9ACTN|nr:homoserine kinase [Nocardioides mesophilus]QNN51952.1 homoserine kinase [Nocardioides mesophilus]
MPTLLTGPVTATVPATSANLGPGYDALGVALSLRDRVTAQVVDGPDEVLVTGEGATTVPRDSTHLVHRSMQAAFEHMGCETPALRLTCENVIPHGRGLGSSSAAIVAGVCLARGLVAGGSLLMDDDAVFALAADLEGHPDNVAPAFYGGFTIAYAEAGRFHAVSVALDPRVCAVALVPPDPVETTVARALLPAVVPHADAAANAGRAALLVAALSRQPELLLAATVDRLHQDYREPAMPASLDLVRTLRAEGLAAVVSGAGPSVLVLTDLGGAAAVAARAPAGWRAWTLSLETDGARVER